jgi:hypothetical protein
MSPREIETMLACGFRSVTVLEPERFESENYLNTKLD